MIMVHEGLVEVSSSVWPMMIDHLWQAPGISAIAWLVCFLAKRAPAKTRYWIWLLASFKCAVPAVFLVWIASPLNLRIPWPSNAITKTPSRAIVEFPFTDHSVAPVVGAASNANRTRVGHAELYCALTLVWGLGSVCCLALLSRRSRALKTALRQGQLLDSGRAANALRRVRELLKEERPIAILVSSAFCEPGVCGILKPTLILSQRMVEAFTNHTTTEEPDQ